MRKVTVQIFYPGSEISVNHYTGRGAGGHTYVKQEAKDFKEQLGWLLKTSHLEEWRLPLKITCNGHFKDKRSTPDLHNLLKLICDGIEELTGINDRYFETATGNPVISKNEEPTLFITVEEGER